MDPVILIGSGVSLLAIGIALARVIAALNPDNRAEKRKSQPILLPEFRLGGSKGRDVPHQGQEIPVAIRAPFVRLGSSAPRTSHGDPREGVRIRSLVLLGVILLVLVFALAMRVGSSDTSLATLDLLHPSTILPMAASGLRTIESGVHEWFDATTASLRERLRHESPKESPAP